MTVATLPVRRGRLHLRGTHARGQREHGRHDLRLGIRVAHAHGALSDALEQSEPSSRCSPQSSSDSAPALDYPRSPAARGYLGRPGSSSWRGVAALILTSQRPSIRVFMEYTRPTIPYVVRRILWARFIWLAYSIVGEASSRADPVLAKHGFAGKLRAPMLQHRARVGPRNQSTKPMHDNDRTGHKSPYGSDVSPLLTAVDTREVNR